LRGRKASTGKRFFFEKKKQKTSAPAGAPAALALYVLCGFFFKKEARSHRLHFTPFTP
jgi:hypothetical protein